MSDTPSTTSCTGYTPDANRISYLLIPIQKKEINYHAVLQALPAAGNLASNRGFFQLFGPVARGLTPRVIISSEYGSGKEFHVAVTHATHAALP
jgi:hypothetical protein